TGSTDAPGRASLGSWLSKRSSVAYLSQPPHLASLAQPSPAVRIARIQREKHQSPYGPKRRRGLLIHGSGVRLPPGALKTAITPSHGRVHVAVCLGWPSRTPLSR